RETCAALSVGISRLHRLHAYRSPADSGAAFRLWCRGVAVGFIRFPPSPVCRRQNNCRSGRRGSRPVTTPDKETERRFTTLIDLRGGRGCLRLAGTTGILVSSDRAQHLHSRSFCYVRQSESIPARPQPLPTSRKDRRRVGLHRPAHSGDLRYPAGGFRNHRMVRAQSRTLIIVSDPIKNFEFLWKTFHDRYPFFDLRKVDWQQQFEIYRAKVTNKTNDDELFEIFCEMLSPLNDGHVELIAKTSGKHFRPEKKPRFHQEFGKQEIEQLFKTTGKTLADNGV